MHVEDACPDLSDADSIFLTIRAFRTATAYGPLLASAREQLKPEVVGEIEAGLALTSADVARAMVQQGATAGADAPISREVRVHRLCGEPGAAVRRHTGLAEDHRWGENGPLRGVDEVRLLDHSHVSACDLRPGGVHGRRTAGRHPDRRPPPGRFLAAASSLTRSSRQRALEIDVHRSDEALNQRLQTGPAGAIMSPATFSGGS